MLGLGLIFWLMARVSTFLGSNPNPNYKCTTLTLIMTVNLT